MKIRNQFFLFLLMLQVTISAYSQVGELSPLVNNQKLLFKANQLSISRKDLYADRYELTASLDNMIVEKEQTAPGDTVLLLSADIKKRARLAIRSSPKDLTVILLKAEGFWSVVRKRMLDYIDTDAYAVRLENDGFTDALAKNKIISWKKQRVRSAQVYYYYDSKVKRGGVYNDSLNILMLNLVMRFDISAMHEWGHALDPNVPNSIIGEASQAFVKGELTKFALKKFPVYSQKGGLEFLAKMEDYERRPEEIRANVWVLRFIADVELGIPMDKTYDEEDVKKMKKFFTKHQDMAYQEFFLKLFPALGKTPGMILRMLNGVADISADPMPEIPGNVRESKADATFDGAQADKFGGIDLSDQARGLEVQGDAGALEMNLLHEDSRLLRQDVQIFYANY